MPFWNFMSLRENKMKELVYIYWEDCAKCHQLMPHVEKRAEEKWYKLQKVQYADSGLEITSIPMAQVITKGEEQILDFDGIVNLISNQK